LKEPLQALPGETAEMAKSVKLKNAFIFWMSDKQVLNARVSEDFLSIDIGTHYGVLLLTSL
jgi:hypothetical protein